MTDFLIGLGIAAAIGIPANLVLWHIAKKETKGKSEILGWSYYLKLHEMEERGKQLVREHDAEVAREIFEKLENRAFGFGPC